MLPSSGNEWPAHGWILLWFTSSLSYLLVDHPIIQETTTAVLGSVCQSRRRRPNAGLAGLCECSPARSLVRARLTLLVKSGQKSGTDSSTGDSHQEPVKSLFRERRPRLTSKNSVNRCFLMPRMSNNRDNAPFRMIRAVEWDSRLG